MISPYIPHSFVNYFTLHVCCTNKKSKVTLFLFLINIVIDLYNTISVHSHSEEVV